MEWPSCRWVIDEFYDSGARGCGNALVHAPGSLVTRDICENCSHAATAHAGASRKELACRLNTPQVTKWAVGLTTAPRRIETLTRTLLSLRDAGWDQPRLFAEPGTAIPVEFSDLPISLRDQTLGAFPNWWLGLAELVMRQPRAEAYFMCQDDVLFSGGLRDYLESSLWPAVNVGVVSVYCPSHVGVGLSNGFHSVNDGWKSWGALAYIFPNPSARAILSDPAVLGHRHHGPRDGLCNVDSIVGNWCDRSGKLYFVHLPSLAQHIGDASTLWKHASNSGRRRAAVFAPLISENSLFGASPDRKLL